MWVCKDIIVVEICTCQANKYSESDVILINILPLIIELTIIMQKASSKTTSAKIENCFGYVIHRLP